jgi:hypothetical protein
MNGHKTHTNGNGTTHADAAGAVSSRGKHVEGGQ